MIGIVILNLFLLLLGIIEGMYRVYKSKHFIEADSISHQEDFSNLYSKVAVIIPVYNEQNVIRQSVLNFKPLMAAGIEVIYVATAKETVEITTYSLLKDLVNEYQLSEYCKVMLYPEKDGVMAHQLNYAINKVENDKIVLIYNVDSVVNKRTIDYILKNKDKLDNGVFQQYSYSTYETKNQFLMSAIMWQNRWSIAYELPRTIDNFKHGIRKFNYVIGHGLALRKEMLDRIGGFPEEQINEDNVLGYKLHAENINIYPIPVLEKIDFASKLKIYVRQQSVWFNGPFYSFQYFSQLKKEKKTIPLFWAACQNFKNALNWLIFPYVTIFSLIYSLILKDIVWVICILLMVLCYVAGINKMSEKLLVDKGYLKHKSGVNLKYAISEMIFWLCIHSFGPLITIYKVIRRKNNQKNKYKTEKINY